MIPARIAPRVSGAKAERQAEILRAIGPVMDGILNDWNINTRLRRAHFLAQIAHESDGFCTTVEYATGAAYEGRKDLGNTVPGDGRRFKGRGLIQLTGRANYQAASRDLGLDLVGNPEMAADPVTSLRIACWYWSNRNINRAADRDDLVAVTRLVNGGTNGLESRRAYLAKAKDALEKETDMTTPTPPQTAHKAGAAGIGAALGSALGGFIGMKLGLDGEMTLALGGAFGTLFATAAAYLKKNYLT